MIKVGPYPIHRRDADDDTVLDFSTWDEMGRKELSRIYIYHGAQVNSIQTAYVEDDSFVFSEKHGGDGDNFDTVSSVNYAFCHN